MKGGSLWCVASGSQTEPDGARRKRVVLFEDMGDCTLDGHPDRSCVGLQRLIMYFSFAHTSPTFIFHYPQEFKIKK
jgi:hypothetical protein